MTKELEKLFLLNQLIPTYKILTKKLNLFKMLNLSQQNAKNKENTSFSNVSRACLLIA